MSSISNFFELEIGIPINRSKSFLQLIEEFKSKNTIIRTIKRFWNDLVGNDSGINYKSFKLPQLQSYVMQYFGKLIEYINVQLKIKDADAHKVGYVLNMEKLLMDTLYISSKNELLDLIKEHDLVDFFNNPRKMIMVDQGENTLSRMVEHTMHPPGYYVHAHISDDHIHLKLKDAVDTKDYNGGIPEMSHVYLKDKLIVMDSVYEQVADTFWEYIQSLEETERCEFMSENDNYKHLYLTYKVQLKRFITKRVNILKKKVILCLMRFLIAIQQSMYTYQL